MKGRLAYDAGGVNWLVMTERRDSQIGWSYCWAAIIDNLIYFYVAVYEGEVTMISITHNC